MRLVIMGPAGAGKGTLASKIKKHYQIAYLASGNMFRSEINQATELGLQAKAYMDQGKLVPDYLTNAMVMKRLSEPEYEQGFMLDGFPRTLYQAQTLQESLRSLGKEIELVVNLLVDYPTLVKRIVARRICPSCDAIYNVVYNPPLIDQICDICGTGLIHRSDDTEESLQVRLGEYHRSTEAVLLFYRDLQIVVDIDATDLPQAVWEEVYPFLEMVK